LALDQALIRAKLEELKQSHAGYSRQLSRLGLSEERRDRLQSEHAFLADEISTLEKIAQLLRVQPDRARVEAVVRERLEEVRARLAADPTFADLSPQERDRSGGEIRALVWSLGEDPFDAAVSRTMQGHERADLTRTARELPSILLRFLENGPNVESRASAAYELGKLHVTSAIPLLATALNDDPEVAAAALHALASFPDEELIAAGLPNATLQQIRTAPG
jgi:hypothetical protein